MPWLLDCFAFCLISVDFMIAIAQFILWIDKNTHFESQFYAVLRTVRIMPVIREYLSIGKCSYSHLSQFSDMTDMSVLSYGRITDSTCPILLAVQVSTGIVCIQPAVIHPIVIITLEFSMPQFNAWYRNYYTTHRLLSWITSSTANTFTSFNLFITLCAMVLYRSRTCKGLSIGISLKQLHMVNRAIFRYLS